MHDNKLIVIGTRTGRFTDCFKFNNNFVFETVDKCPDY